MKRYKFLLFVNVLCFALSPVKAQKQSEVLFSIAPVFSGIDLGSYLDPIDKVKFKGGTSISVQYNFPMSSKTAFGLGLGYTKIKEEALVSDYTYWGGMTSDDEGDSYQQVIRMKDFRERCTISMFDIPISFMFRYPLTNRFFMSETDADSDADAVKKFSRKQWVSFYMQFGAKVSLILKSESDILNGSASLSGYYPQYGVLLENMPQHGFGAYDIIGKSASVKADLPLAVTPFLEIGVKIPIWNRLEALVGVYAAYPVSFASASSVDASSSSEDYFTTYELDNSSYRYIPLTIGLKFSLMFSFPR